MEVAFSSPSPQKPLVILNPTANRGHMDIHRALVRQHLRQISAEYIETSQAGEAKDWAMQAARADRPIVIVGGDGSINEVVNGILEAGRRVPLGIVAAGSGNDLASSTLKLPLEPKAALERAFSGRPIAVDAGKVNGRYFANACSIGLDADIGGAAEKLKRYPFLSGGRLYYAAILRQLFFGYHRCPWLTICLDGEGMEGKTERRYLLAAISNGPAYGAGFRINPTARYDDGLLDVCTVDYLPLLRTLKLLPIAKKGQHTRIPEVTFHRVRRAVIDSRTPVTIQMDGEIARATHFEIEIIPGALWIRV
jgi:diacylglycerol kinase (ATP)